MFTFSSSYHACINCMSLLKFFDKFRKLRPPLISLSSLPRPPWPFHCKPSSPITTSFFFYRITSGKSGVFSRSSRPLSYRHLAAGTFSITCQLSSTRKYHSAAKPIEMSSRSHQQQWQSNPRLYWACNSKLHTNVYKDSSRKGRASIKKVLV